MRKTRRFYIIQSVIFSVLSYILIIISLAFNSLYTPIEDEENGVFIELEDFIPKPLDLTQIPEENLNSEDRRNIAVNKAMKGQKETDPYDYSDIEKSDDAYKEQLIKDAISDKEYTKIFERNDINLEDNIPEEKIEETKNTEEDTPSNFQGATYITYSLEDRYKMKIPVPTYRCETSGKIIIRIVVNQDGRVVSYEISAKSSLDDCLKNAAIKSVKNSKFNQNYDAPSKQRGVIIYTFEAQ